MDLAALFVKVSNSISSGFTPEMYALYALSAITSVLPVPAGAITISAPKTLS